MNISPASQQRSITAYGALEKQAAPASTNDEEKILVKDNHTDGKEEIDHILGDKATGALNSGTDITIDPFLDDIKKNQQEQIDRVKNLINKNDKKIDTYKKFEEGLKNFRDLCDELSTIGSQKFFSTTPNSSAFELDLTNKAQSGSHKVEISQIAEPHQLKSHELPGLKTELAGSTSGDTRTLTIQLANDKSFDIKLNKSQTSPLEISKAINAAKIGVTANVIQAANNKSYLVISSSETGTDAAIRSINVTDDNELNKILKYPITAPSTEGMEQKQPAKNAELTIDGFSITRQSNRIDDVMEGITFILKEKTDSSQPIIAKIDTDNEKLVEALTKGLIGSYNNLKAFENEKTKIGSEDALDYNNPISNIMKSLTKVMEMKFGDGKASSLLALSFQKKYDLLDPSDSNNTNGIFEPQNEQLFKEIIQNNMTEFKELFLGNGEHKGLIGEMKDLLTKELNNRLSAPLFQAQNSLKNDNKKLNDKIETIKETTSTKIRKLKTQFAYLQEAMTRFNDATNYFKMLSGSKD